MKYIVALEVYDDSCVFLATWSGDPGRTVTEQNAKRYNTVSSATFGLAHARKYRDFQTAEIRQVTQ